MRFKKIVLIIFLFFSVAEFIKAKKSALMGKHVFSQRYKINYIIICDYKLTYYPDSSKADSRSEYLQLSIGKELTKFQSPSSRVRDSLTSIAVTLPRSQRTQTAIDFYTRGILSLPKTGFRYMIFKNPLTGKVIYYDWIGPNLYRYEESNPLFKWVITNSKETVAGYICQKATTTFAGRKFEAWFTREVPVSDGPYKFNGLPGLITKVSDSKNQYLFELVKLSKAQSTDGVAFPTKTATTTTKKALRIGQDSYNASIADRMAAMGNNINKANQQRSKSHLNPLELK